MHGINLVTHPLTGQSRGVRPEEAILKMFAGIERLERTVHEEPLPVSILFAHLCDEIRSPPTTRLVDVPGQRNHGNWSTLARHDKLSSSMIILSTTAL